MVDLAPRRSKSIAWNGSRHPIATTQFLPRTAGREPISARSLATWAERLGAWGTWPPCGARRSGPSTRTMPTKLETLGRHPGSGDATSSLLPVEAGLAGLACCSVSAADAGRLARGQAVLLRGRDAPLLAGWIRSARKARWWRWPRPSRASCGRGASSIFLARRGQIAIHGHGSCRSTMREFLWHSRRICDIAGSRGHLPARDAYGDRAGRHPGAGRRASMTETNNRNRIYPMSLTPGRKAEVIKAMQPSPAIPARRKCKWRSFRSASTASPSISRPTSRTTIPAVDCSSSYRSGANSSTISLASTKHVTNR